MADQVYIDYSVLSGPNGDDLDATFTPLGSNEEVLLQDVYKQVTTPAGSCFWAPTKTMDLRDLLNDSVSTSEIADLAAKLEGLFEEDPRMQVSAAVSFDGLARTLTVTLTITPKQGDTFVLVLTADSNEVRIERAS